MVTLDGQDSIYSSKTKEYFKEVVLDYEVGNYRSALVMLYSTVIYDLINKLVELDEVYLDKNASKILKDIKAQRNTESGSKSLWEKSLLDSLKKQTGLLDEHAYEAINNLYFYRNLSAHPALNDNYELISPSREITIAYIREMLELVFVKPPLLTGKIIDYLTDDLEKVYPHYVKDLEGLKAFLDKKYFNRLNNPEKIRCFKALWKFCFYSSNSEVCMNNIMPNRRALEILYDEIDGIDDVIKNDKYYETIPDSDTTRKHLFYFTSRCPRLYKSFSDVLKKTVDEYANKPNLMALAWFNKKNKIDHLEFLLKEDEAKISEELSLKIKKQYEKDGYKREWLEFCIKKYSLSTCYDMADERFRIFISPNLNEFDMDNYQSLFKAINTNDQIYGRGMAFSSNTVIIKYFLQKYGNYKLLKKYQNLIFDESVQTEYSDDSLAEES